MTVGNFARSTLASGIAAGAVSMTSATGEGARFAGFATPYPITLWNSTDYASADLDPNREIVICTARSTDTFTITRGGESTSDVAHNTGGKTYSMIAGLTAAKINLMARLFVPRVMTAAGTLAVGETWVIYDTSAGAFTVTMPAISAVPVGYEVFFSPYGSSGAAVITVAGAGADTIKDGQASGASTNTATKAFGTGAFRKRLLSDGTSWHYN